MRSKGRGLEDVCASLFLIRLYRYNINEVLVNAAGELGREGHQKLQV